MEINDLMTVKNNAYKSVNNASKAMLEQSGNFNKQKILKSIKEKAQR